MKNLSYFQILKLSLQRTKEIFLKPFSVKRWLKLLFIAMVAMQMTGSGSVKDIYDLFNGGILEKDASAQAESVPQENPMGPLQNFQQDAVVFWEHNQTHPMFGVFLASLFVLIIFFIILMIWLAARFHFVWLHSLFTGDIAIKKPFREYQKEGRSLFLFSLLFNFLFFIILGPIVAWTIISLLRFDGGKVDFSWWWQLPGMIPGVVFFVGLVLAGTLVLFYISHVAVPIMAVKRVRIGEAWKEFKGLFKVNVSDMLLLPLIFLGLSFLTRIAGFIVFLLIALIGILIAALVGGILYFLFHHILAVQYAGNIVLIALGVVWAAVMIVVLAMSQVPFVVFLRYVTLHVLASLDPAYDRIRLAPSIQDHHIQPPPSTDV